MRELYAEIDKYKVDTEIDFDYSEIRHCLTIGASMKMAVHMTCFPLNPVSNEVVVGDLMIIIRNINNF
jgi:hypothetical protein